MTFNKNMNTENNQEIQLPKVSAFVHKSLTVNASTHTAVVSHCKLHNLKLSHWASDVLLTAVTQSALTPKN